MEQRNAHIPSSSARTIQPSATLPATKMVTTVPCTSTECLQFGTPEKNGFCDEYFHKKGKVRPRAPAAKGDQQHSSRATEQTPQMVAGFVPTSYPLKDPVQVCQAQSPPYGSRVRHHSGNAEDDVQGQRCCGTNCTLFGTPETNGYCSRCFLESTIPQSGPVSIPGNNS